MLLLTTVNPTFNKGTLINVEIWGGRGGGVWGEDDVEKVGRTSGKILTKHLLSLKLNNKSLDETSSVIICPGSYFQGSADQESLMAE